MPTLIERLAYPCVKYQLGSKRVFATEEIAIPELNINIELDIIVPYTSPKTPDCTVIYSHGNAEHMQHVHGLLVEYSNIFRCRFVGYDYLGYGSNTGCPTEKTSRILVLNIYKYVVEKFPGTTIISWGRSIGSAPAVYLAHQYPSVKYLIVYSGLSSAMQTMLKVGIRCLDYFENWRFLRTIKCKTLILHGVEDEVIPFRCSVTNFKAYVRRNCGGYQIKKEFCRGYSVYRVGDMTHVSIDGAGHNNLDSYYQEIVVGSVMSLIGDDIGVCACHANSGAI